MEGGGEEGRGRGGEEGRKESRKGGIRGGWEGEERRRRLSVVEIRNADQAKECEMSGGMVHRPPPTDTRGHQGAGFGVHLPSSEL